MDEQIQKAERLFNEGNTDESLSVLNDLFIISERNIDGLLLRAKVFYRMQRWGDSLNDLNHILEIDKEHILAKNYKTMVMNIISYWNKDNFNP